MDDVKVTVVGLVDLQKALRQIDKGLGKELAVGLAEAAQIVADAAAPTVPRRTGRAAASIKVRKRQTSAALAVGGTAAPYFPWLDFGGVTGRGGGARRPFKPGGRYIYPALSRKNSQVKAKVDEVLERLARRAGFETTGDSTSG